MVKNLKYPNLTILVLILVITFILLRTGTLNEWVSYLNNWGYIGAFFAGIFFVSTFTVAPAIAVLVLFAEHLNIIAVSLLAGLGGVIGDYAIFRFVEDELLSELKSIFYKVGGGNIFRAHHIAHTKYFAWLWPVIGALIIASPFPDELGIAILGVYRLSPKKFAVLSFVLNTVGIFLLVAAGEAVMP